MRTTDSWYNTQTVNTKDNERQSTRHGSHENPQEQAVPQEKQTRVDKNRQPDIRWRAEKDWQTGTRPDGWAHTTEYARRIKPSQQRTTTQSKVDVLATRYWLFRQPVSTKEDDAHALSFIFTSLALVDRYSWTVIELADFRELEAFTIAYLFRHPTARITPHRSCLFLVCVCVKWIAWVVLSAAVLATKWISFVFRRCLLSWATTLYNRKTKLLCVI